MIIKSITDNAIVTPNSEAILECVVDGHPLTETSVTWERKSFDMDTKTTTTFNAENKTSILTIHEASRTDVGQFTCVANNGVGNTTKKTAFLIVKCKLGTFSIRLALSV